jgi:hypothetical protein
VVSLLAASCCGQSLGQTAARQEPSTGAGQVAVGPPASVARPSETAPSASPWEFNLSVSGYIIPHGQSFVSPTLSADRNTLHLEARYNYEAHRTGSLWAGYNFSVGKKVELDVTPMIGGVFGRLNGVSPGLEATITWKKLQLYSANEYIFDTNTKDGNFFYTWTQLMYSPTNWFSAGYVMQRTRAYQTAVDVQRGLQVEFTHKKVTFATQVFNLGVDDPTIVLALGYTF